MSTVTVLLAALLACGVGEPSLAAPAPDVAGAPEDVAWWTCPMHTSVHAPGPGSCPICGMTLTPVTWAEVRSGAVTVDASRRALAGIELAAATVRPMRETLRAVGIVAWDQARLSDMTLKVAGYLRDVRVAAVGERVRRGQVLFTLYSPDLLVAQEDLLAALAQARAGEPGAGERAAAARRRLELWDLAEAEIEALVARGHAREAVPIRATAAGRVIEEFVAEGAAVEPGMRLYRIGDPRRVWVEARLPERDLARVAPGLPVRVTFPHLPEARAGTLALLLPELDDASRTGTARIVLDNRDGALLPDQWATVEIDLETGPRLAVPASAVLYTGPRRVVFVDVGQDRLAPRSVRVGAQSEGWVAVEEGLVEGERVVVAGNFLVAAESRVQSGEGAW